MQWAYPKRTGRARSHTIPVTIRLSQSQYAQLERHAEHRQTNTIQLAEELIEVFLVDQRSHEPSPLQRLATEAQLIGGSL